MKDSNLPVAILLLGTASLTLAGPRLECFNQTQKRLEERKAAAAQAAKTTNDTALSAMVCQSPCGCTGGSI